MGVSLRSRICQRAAIIGAASRKGDSAWGRKMMGLRANKAMRQAYPDLVALWRMNGTRASMGLPPLPVPSLEGVARHSKKPRPASSVEVQHGGGPVGG